MVSILTVHKQNPKNYYSQGEEHQPSQGLLHHHHSSLLSVMLFLLFLASCTAGVHAQRRGSITYPLLAAIPETAFRCPGRSAGYYADVETDCQVYHMCDTLEKQFSYLCPKYTLFNQKFMVCDHWYMVNCTISDSFFDLNDHIGEVPDKGSNAIDRGNNLGMRKSTILAKKPQGTHSFKAIVPVSLKKFQSTSKTTQAPSSRPTLLPTNTPVSSQSSFFTLPKSPFMIKTATKTTNSPSISQTSGFVKIKFVSTTQRPLNPFFNSAFTRRPFSVPSLNSSLSTTLKPARTSVFNRSTLTTTPRSPVPRTSVFTTRRFTTPSPLNPFTNSVFTRPSSSIPSLHFKSAATSKPATSSVINHKGVTFTTPKPSRTAVFNSNKPATTTRPDFSRTAAFNHNTLTSTKPPSTIAMKKPFNIRFPGNVARKPGSSFSFAQMKLHNLTISRQQLEGLIFRPLVANPFAIKNRSSIPSFPFGSTSKPLKSNLKGHPLVTTPHSLLLDSDEEEDQTSQHSTQQILAAPLRALAVPSQSFGIPVPSRLLVPPPFSGIINTLQSPIATLIEPPTARRKGTSPIKLSRTVINNPRVVRTNPGQESPFTPFTKNPPKFIPFGISEEVIPGVLHVSFQSARGNRDFFIPSSGLTLPEETLKTPSNSLGTNLDDHDHDRNDNGPHREHGAHDRSDLHMTMLFPGFSGTPVISALVLNPKCPHCHPAFLRPGRCTPCVRIRR